MCKLLAIVDIENEDKAIEFSELAVKPMTARDDDGLGIIMLGDSGMGIERWLKPDTFPEQQSVDSSLAKYRALLPLSYNTEGSISQTNLYALGVHSRMATGPKTLENVHPFVREGLALTHNGVISNHTKFKKEVSTCDSEALLSLYIDYEIKTKLENIQLLCDEAKGWYAFMVFNPEEKSLTIVKDDKTPLFMAHIPTVGVVFSTSDDIIKATCGKMKIKQPHIYPFPANTAMRWIKDKAEIETFEIEEPLSQYQTWPEEKEKKVIDLSRFCDHGITIGTWCRECYVLTGETNDIPPHLRS